MDAITRRLNVNPAIGLGVAVTIGLALGTGALDGLLPFGRSASAPTPTPAPAASGAAGTPVARPPSGDLAASLDDLDQEL